MLHICLLRIPFNTEILLVQNPPTIPTLALAQLIARVAGSRLLIDWHNTGYSILALRVGDSSLLVKIAKWYTSLHVQRSRSANSRFEQNFGRSARAHLFVTHALEQYLSKEWHLV